MTKFERFILNIPFIRFLTEKSKKIVLPGFEGVPLYDVVVFFISQIRKVGLNERAAAISFNLLMAIPAATIFLCTLIPYMPFISNEIANELLLLTRDLTPNQNTYELVKGFLEDFLLKERGSLLSIGFVIAIYYASNAIIGIMHSFNRSLIYSNKRNFFQERWMAIRLTIVLILMVIATITLLVTTQGSVLRSIFEWLDIKDQASKWLLLGTKWIIILAMFFYSIAFIYKYAPAVHKRWRLSSPGAILTTTLIVVLTLGFSYWVNNFGTYNKVYGSIGTILILMLLIYWNSLVLLIGYELNVSIHSIKAMADERARHEAEEEQKAKGKGQEAISNKQ